MNYYIYISDQKVDMLAGQIPEKKLRDLANQFEFSINLPWLPLSITYKPGEPMPTDSHRIKRLKIIENTFDPTDIGGITVNRPWIKSSLNMSWGFIDDERRSVWFFGKSSDTTIVMGGSAKHLLGSVEPDQQYHHAYSLLPVLTQTLVERAKIDDPSIESGQMPNIISAARMLINTAIGPRERLSFLARRLMTTSDADGKLILASPLYVISSPS